MGSIRAVLVVVIVSLLTACGGTSEQMAAFQDGIPLVNVIREPSGKETVLTGTIKPKINFTSTYTSQSDDGIKCSGKFSNRGVGFMNCSNGWKMALTIPKDKYGTVNGSYVETADGIGVATGWGKEANADLLRAKM